MRHPQGRTLSGVILAVLLAASPLTAQQPPPPETRQSPAGPQPPQQFRAAVNTVRVDVVVEDGDDNFVDDLAVADFTLLEDGEPRQIVGVQLVDLAAGTVRRVGAGVTTDEIRAEPAGSDAAAAREMGAVVFFIDLPGLYMQNTIRFAEAMEGVLDTIGGSRLPYAVYLVDMSGRLRVLQPLTTDLNAMARTAAEVRNTVPPEDRKSLFERITPETGALGRIARYEQRRRAIYTFGLLRDFIDSLAHRSGRTALVWVSSGVDLAAYERVERPNRILGEANALPGVFRTYSPDETVLGLQEELHRAANSANVSIYSVDPSALADFFVVEGGGVAVDKRIGSIEDARGNSLRNAAASTGGDVFIGWTELDRVLENIERDTGRFYLLSYVPPRQEGDGRYHEIRVEVDRDGARVRARRGYVHYTAADRRSRILRAALDLPGTASGFDVAVDGGRARAPDGQPLLIVNAAVASGGPAAGGAPVDPASLLVYATVRDDAANLVASVEAGHLTPAGPVPGTAAGGDRIHWMHRTLHRLDPGAYDVRVAVVDPVSERVGAARLEVEIDDASGAWDASDPWLAVPGADGSLIPVVEGRVSSGQAVAAYIEVYNGASPTVSGRILPGASVDAFGPPEETIEIEAGDLSAPGRRDPAMALAEASGIHRGSVPLTALPPGHYVLEFRIEDPGAGRARTVRLPLEVVPGR